MGSRLRIRGISLCKAEFLIVTVHVPPGAQLLRMLTPLRALQGQHPQPHRDLCCLPCSVQAEHPGHPQGWGPPVGEQVCLLQGVPFPKRHPEGRSQRDKCRH